MKTVTPEELTGRIEKLLNEDRTFRNFHMKYVIEKKEDYVGIGLSKEITPGDEIDGLFYKALVEEYKKTLNIDGDSIQLWIQRIDTSSEDLPPGTEYSYYLKGYAKVRSANETEKVINTAKLLKKVVENYLKGSKVIINRLLEEGEIPEEEAFDLFKELVHEDLRVDPIKF